MPSVERPILFSASMVRALLDGSKTQTRRVVKWRDLQPGLNLSFSGLEVYSYVPGLFTLEGRSRNSVESRSSPTRCPYGDPGDRLWVREAFGISYDGSSIPWTGADPQRDGEVIYRATFDEKPEEGRLPWKPSIHMPRWASRIVLEITGVRVERLQAISEADARAEGVVPNDGYAGPPEFRNSGWKKAYRVLWEQINGAGSWDANPFVWVVEFRKS